MTPIIPLRQIRQCISENVLWALKFFISFCLFLSCQRREEPAAIYVSDEINGRIAVGAGDELFFSKKRNDIFTIHKYANDSLVPFAVGSKDILNPFFVQDSVYGMTDGYGDENFITNNPVMNGRLGGKAIRYLYSSPKSSCIIYSYVNSKMLCLYNLENSRKINLFVFRDKVNGVDFAEGHIVISADKSLYLVDLTTYSVDLLAPEIHGEKLNPAISGNEVYFVNNDLTEFYNIYKAALKSGSAATHCYGSKGDLRMPKAYGGRLYFIEIQQSKYLLSYLDHKENKTRITSDGVVFNYNVSDDKVLFTHSTINLPRSLCSYDPVSGKVVIHGAERPGIDLLASFVTSPSGKSYGYKIASRKGVGHKGVILFLKGGGKRSDFSPRWDDILVNLANNGYEIYAPNFPSSAGYGKSYLNQTSDQAILDLLEWKKFISGKYPGRNFYMLSSSSGNLYMEEILKRDHVGIKATASIVGLFSHKPPRNLLPMLYILGEKDPFVNASVRKSSIWWNSWFMINKKVIVYRNEGHWLRRTANIENAIGSIIDFFEEQ